MAGMSMAEYLKRYTDGPTKDETKKKKKKKLKTAVKSVQPRSRIVDDDVDFSSTLPSNLENTLDEDVGDNDPTVAAFIDERPDDVKLLERFRDSDGKWKVLTEEQRMKKLNESDLSKEKFVSNSHTSPSKRQRHDSGSDQSLPRRQRHDSGSDQSPPRKKRHDSDSDQSPPRRQGHDSGSDQSPPRRQRHDSGSDQSPPRKKRHDSDSDQSPPRRQRHDSGSDQSPPRKKRHGSDSDQSPPRRQRHDSGSDQSPPRKKRHGSDSDQSPPRRQRRDSGTDQSSLRRQSKNSGSGSSHQRNKSHSTDIDSSSQKKTETITKKKKTRWNEESDHEEKTEDGKMSKTLSGKKAGLSSAKEMKVEAQIIKKREEVAFKKIGDERLGKNAVTVFRDKKSGKRRDLQKESEEDAEKAAKQAILDAKYENWSKGLKQKSDKEAMIMDHIHEMNKPMARHRDDEDLDKMLRNVVREEDPMLAFIKKKPKGDKPKKELPKYKGPAPPPNRYGIPPGYRWDGVNRTNGFEAKLFANISNKKAVADMAHKWSVEDM